MQGGRWGGPDMILPPDMMMQGGQMRGMGGGMQGGMTPEAMQQARMQRVQAMLQNIDANHNGIIEPEEAQGPNAFMLDRILRGAGVEPTYPMPVSKVQEAMNNRSRSRMPGNAQAPASTESKPTEETKSAADSGPRLVPGFDVSIAKQPSVPGFGVPGAQAATDTKKTGTSSETSTASATSTSSAAQNDEKIRKYAEALLKQNDANKNGKLEKEEWSEMPQTRRGLKAADKNNDGVITLDELAEWLAADSQSGPKQSSAATASAPSSSAGSNTVASQGKSGKSKTHHFLSPSERLPKGLPDWFARKDADGDGQVSMFEYSSGDWTATKAQEFAHYDLNNDGIITPGECLKVDKKK